MHKAISIFIGLMLFLLPGCAAQRAQEATDAKTQMIGMTKEQLLACAGIPTQKAAEGKLELWSYATGNDHTSAMISAPANTGIATGVATRRYCTVNIAIESGRVVRVSYSGATGGLLTEGEQCAFAVSNCLQRTR